LPSKHLVKTKENVAMAKMPTGNEGKNWIKKKKEVFVCSWAKKKSGGQEAPPWKGGQPGERGDFASQKKAQKKKKNDTGGVKHADQEKRGTQEGVFRGKTWRS